MNRPLKGGNSSRPFNIKVRPRNGRIPWCKACRTWPALSLFLNSPSNADGPRLPSVRNFSDVPGKLTTQYRFRQAQGSRRLGGDVLSTERGSSRLVWQENGRFLAPPVAPVLLPA